MSHRKHLSRPLHIVAVMIAAISATGCDSPQTGSIDLGKTPIGIESEVHEAAKPTAKAPTAK